VAGLLAKQQRSIAPEHWETTHRREGLTLKVPEATVQVKAKWQ
jgi:hypothetical protein